MIKIGQLALYVFEIVDDDRRQSIGTLRLRWANYKDRGDENDIARKDVLLTQIILACCSLHSDHAFKRNKTLFKAVWLTIIERIIVSLKTKYKIYTWSSFLLI